MLKEAKEREEKEKRKGRVLTTEEREGRWRRSRSMLKRYADLDCYYTHSLTHSALRLLAHAHHC